MPQTVTYFLRPRGAFHFGERGVGIEETADILHSDTLFAAIVSAWQMLGKNVKQLTAPFVGDSAPPFRISSAFPYARDVLFFPAPQAKLGESKMLKKVRYISTGALERLQKLGDIDKRELIQDKRVWVTPQERDRIGVDRLWSRADESIAPHVAIDRVTSGSNIYYSGRISYAPDCGLYFWAELADDAYREHLEAALRFLENEGLGGRRSTGSGQFNLDFEARALPQTANANCWMTLSLYHPRQEELRARILNDASYALIQRRGWIDSPDGRNWRRKGLWMLSEGSILKRPARGQVVDLQPNLEKLKTPDPPLSHPIWRSGLAFAMPIRLGEEAQ